MDADRPNLQLPLGSVKEERRKYTSEQEVGYCCSKLKHGGSRIPLKRRLQAWFLLKVLGIWLNHEQKLRSEEGGLRLRPCPGLFPLL